MPIEFDLTKVANNLGRDRKEVKGLIRKIIGAFAIRHDLKEASQALDVFWKWHKNNVVLARTALGDAGDEGLIGRAIFVLVAMRLSRALDTGADGRVRIDITPAIRKAGLEQALIAVKALRSEELAHYGGFTPGIQPFSDDRALLIVGDDKKSYIAPAFLRWNSSRTLALQMSSLILCCTDFVEQYTSKNRGHLLEIIRSDKKLRSEMLEAGPSNLFSSEGFFGPGIKTKCPPEGPIIEIDW